MYTQLMYGFVQKFTKGLLLWVLQYPNPKPNKE